MDIDSIDDGVTMQMTSHGQLLHGPQCTSRCGSRPRHGLQLDIRGIKIIQSVDPGISARALRRATAALLSAISALAEFDGAIFELFKKTPNMRRRCPGDGSEPLPASPST